MATEVTIPSPGESITQVWIGEWRKSAGDFVEEGEILLEVESDKATLEIPAPASGRLVDVQGEPGDEVPVGAVVARIETVEGSVPKEKAAEVTEEATSDSKALNREGATPSQEAGVKEEVEPSPLVMPSAGRLIEKHGLDPKQIPASGPGGRVLKEDVLRRLDDETPEVEAKPAPVEGERTTRTERMSPIRMRIAERLVEAQNQAALLTTFNEADMTEVIELRRTYQEEFQEKHGVKLGFMSFFVKASVVALKEFPEINAQIQPGERGLEIKYHDYHDIGIAIGGGKGLVVPVIRNAESMSFAQIEKTIADFAKRARENKISLDELAGGTFTISNGGVYGSLLSTPIINPPQSGILGLHAIEDRPVARNGEVVIRKMMYLALTYDHRIVDGREAVTFLRRIKSCIENPARMLLDV